jgi:hypothetical protein
VGKVWVLRDLGVSDNRYWRHRERAAEEVLMKEPRREVRPESQRRRGTIYGKESLIPKVDVGPGRPTKLGIREAEYRRPGS